jgi:hypothetical protein
MRAPERRAGVRVKLWRLCLHLIFFLLRFFLALRTVGGQVLSRWMMSTPSWGAGTSGAWSTGRVRAGAPRPSAVKCWASGLIMRSSSAIGTQLGPYNHRPLDRDADAGHDDGALRCGSDCLLVLRCVL